MPPAKKPVDEVVGEPVEAQPPAGVVLDEAMMSGEATDAEMARLNEAIRLAHPLPEPTVETPKPVETPVAVLPKVRKGQIVLYILDRNILDTLTLQGVVVNTMARGDVVPAMVVKTYPASDSADLRVFVDSDALPCVRGVPQMLQPDEVTLDHTGNFFVT
jgi:hypothetical protein